MRSVFVHILWQLLQNSCPHHSSFIELFCNRPHLTSLLILHSSPLSLLVNRRYKHNQGKVTVPPTFRQTSLNELITHKLSPRFDQLPLTVLITYFSPFRLTFTDYLYYQFLLSLSRPTFTDNLDQLLLSRNVQFSHAIDFISALLRAGALLALGSALAARHDLGFTANNIRPQISVSLITVGLKFF